MFIMKTSKIVPMMLALLMLAALGGVTPKAHAQSVTSTKWLTPAFSGFDPYYGSPVNAYTMGSTATLSVQFANFGGNTIKVIAVQVGMDWGSNSSASALPKTMTPGSTTSFTISVSVPSTSGLNLVAHDSISSWTFVKYNTTIGSSTFTTPVSFGTSPLAAYSSDQLSAMTALQQLSFLSSSGGTTLSIFKTPQASTLLAQAAQQGSLGVQLYTIGNFTGAKTDLQNAVSLWNQAISAENSHGNTLELNNTLGGYGSLLLGLGAIIGGAAAIIYAIRRPKMLSGATGPTTH